MLKTSYPSSRRLFIAALAAPLAAGWLPALAQTPAPKPIRLVVGFPAGGSTDVVARLLAEALRTKLNIPVMVDNKPGAAGRLAIENMKAAEPDGTVVLITPNPMITVYPHVYRRLSYDPARDVVPVAQVASYPLLIAVGPAVPASVKTPRDFMQWARTDARNAFYASPATGSTPHFVGVMMGKAAGVPLTHVAFKGDAPAIQDLLGGMVPMSINVPAAQLPHIASGRLRVLATTGARRMAELPEVPTMAESGFPDLKTSDWFGAFVPARTPTAVVARIQNALQEALASKEVREGFAKQGIQADFVAAGEFGRRIKEETTRWGAVVRASDFKPED